MPGREPNFAVARFDKTTDEVMIKMGFLFETVAKAGDVYSFKGKNARRDAIGAARDMLIGRY